MPTNRGTRHNPRWVGTVSYKGREKWVGTYGHIDEYNEAARERRAELREEVDGNAEQEVPTVSKFAGAVFREDGGITITWPEGQPSRKEGGRRESSDRRLREALRPFVREHGDRRMDSFSRDEALTWGSKHGTHAKQAVRQFFNHAVDRDLIAKNHFARIGGSRRKRRVDRPDFEILTDAQYERLLRAARGSRADDDDYRLIIEGAVLAVGEAALRPGEVFALHRDEVDWKNNLIPVKWNLDSRTRKRYWPKDDDPRWVVMSPRLRAHWERMPVMGKILLPAPRGGYMTSYNWHHFWTTVRASAGLPKLEFYELKHRAIQWMVDPVEDGGLGLDAQTVALMVGHDDGGFLISTVYTKLSDKRARERAGRAMDAYVERRGAERPKLHVVGEK